jgi:tRNA modification GTPase
MVLDHALMLWGPDTATGEDLAELHCHGGRAVIAAVEGALATLPGLRRAEPGEFTRRAFAHGRIDLAQAEGLADLLSAETELQRQAAMAVAGAACRGRSRHGGWMC